MKNTKKTIREILKKFPNLRDNDNALVAFVWNKETPAILNKDRFLEMLAHGKLTRPETILRYKREILKK